MAGLAAVAAGLRINAAQGDAEAAGLAVRHRLEIDGDRCLLVFDNATDPVVLQRFIPVAGTGRVIITSNQRSMATLGAGVPVDVFSEPEALAFLAERTGLPDVEGARAVAVELGYLPLALAQAAAVIADQHLGYGTYLDRLRGMRVGELLRPVEAGQYPRGVAAAVLLSLDGARTGDDTGVCLAVIELLAVLSPAGVRRALVHAAARQGVLAGDRQAGALPAEVVDRALARLAGASLLTFSVDGSSVIAHRLVMRVIREQLAAEDSLMAVCAGAARLLDGLAQPLSQTWHKDLAAVRDMVEQIMALSESSVGCPADSALVGRILRLKGRAVWFLNHGILGLRCANFAPTHCAANVQPIGFHVTPLQSLNLALAQPEEESECHDELTFNVVHQSRDDIFNLLQCVVRGLARCLRFAQHFDIVPWIRFKQPQVDRVREDAGTQAPDVLHGAPSKGLGKAGQKCGTS